MSRRRPSDPLRALRRLPHTVRQALRPPRAAGGDAPIAGEPMPLWSSARERLTAATQVSTERTWQVLTDIVRRDGMHGAWMGCCVLANITQDALAAQHQTSRATDVGSPPVEGRHRVRAAEFVMCWITGDSAGAWSVLTANTDRDDTNRFLFVMASNAVRAVRGDVELRDRLRWP